VRYWLRRHDLRTTREARLRARRAAPAGERFVGVCERHGETRFVVRSDGPSRRERCRVEAVAKRRRQVKALLGRVGVARSLERAREEALKCVLLCSNRHAEVEGGAAALPAKLALRAAEYPR
jgi:hypothetical protein